MTNHFAQKQLLNNSSYFIDSKSMKVNEMCNVVHVFQVIWTGNSYS